MADVISYRREGDIGIVTIDSPPVNALSFPVRSGLMAAFGEFEDDPGAAAAVLICAGQTFIAGADISEFDKPMEGPWLTEVVHRIEDCCKVVVAAIHGTALGGGVEIAMGCHYRCALPSAEIGMPEVLLGLLPGASGTQRLPRLLGVPDALDLMISGRPIGAAVAREKGAVDEIVDGDLEAGAIAYARRLASGQALLRRIRETAIDRTALPADFFPKYRESIARQTRGFFAPERIVQCVEAAVSLPYDAAVAREKALFMDCLNSTESKGQRHLFFADREAAKIPDVPKDTPVREVKKVAVIGGGTMGGGIAMCFAGAGIPVVLKEVAQDALDRGIGIIRGNYEAAVKKGRMSARQLAETMGLIKGTLRYDEVADADLVIEAVFENMALKKDIFGTLDGWCKAGAILATNTSTLDVDEVAAATRRPEDVIGLHFFAPANVMALLEIVRGARTAKDVIATSMAVAKTIRKIGVLVGVCFGFVGNRMFFPYVREAQMMLLEGVPPERVDQVAFDWGMAMGPHGVCDLSGLDVFDKLNSEWKDRPDDPSYCRMIGKLVAMGRFGQKTGAGIYKYEGRSAVPDPEVMAMAKAEAEALGIEPLEISDEEIIERLFYAMINEGARILEEGIALRPGDIDVVYTSGYGMPRYRGGPMFYADTVGLDRVHAAIGKYRQRYGDRYWTPAPLLEKLAGAGSSFAEWSAARR